MSRSVWRKDFHSGQNLRANEPLQRDLLLTFHSLGRWSDYGRAYHDNAT